jgi:hypothetical protein
MIVRAVHQHLDTAFVLVHSELDQALNGQVVHLPGHLFMKPDQLIVGVAVHAAIIVGGSPNRRPLDSRSLTPTGSR